MLQATIGAEAGQYSWPSGGTSNKYPPSNIAPMAPLQAMTCGYGFKYANGYCMSAGCFDQRSSCFVIDAYGKTCTYDQILAYQSKTGQKACGPAPQLPPPPNAPNPTPGGLPPPPPSQVVDAPSPGTKVVLSPEQQPTTGLVPGFQIPRWVWVVGGLSALGIVIALVARR